ncbi:aminotransferase-like domain-containing protein [Marinobacter sp. SS21]|uniref:aminotransferase-like domain-containing protein n=1 Tax=Marinobacter sp. SS21 TaxID=2979460 RepID=UPI00232D5623|nr:PLP-dependent aminotransferase family protein [Marinobacter sp. SS21]MDC0662351.1 PLP-dependent aminotransferase family protein [Marinobacter sp. SS21]
MKRFEQLAHDIAELIRGGTLQPGQRIPSVRMASRQYNVSPSTVFRAYYLLENLGLVHARPQSGYFVTSLTSHPLPETSAPQREPRTTPVDVSELVFSILRSMREASQVPLGSAFPSPSLFPLRRLARSMAKATRLMDVNSVVTDLPPGNLQLRRQIAVRYAISGVSVPADEILVTDGALEALNLCLQAITQPGDLVAIEAPAFYACLQVLERLQLQAVEIPVAASGGIDLAVLERALQQHDIKACWFMTNFQNPTGVSLNAERKQQLVALLHRHQIPLVEDDVYGELYFGQQAPVMAKSFDRDGLVLHCSSFSKCLAPGYRVGWVSAGRYLERLQRLKLMTTLSASVPAQAALADYLEFGGFDRHLRGLRAELEAQKHQLFAAIDRYFPADVRVTRPDGGYFLWLELARNVDSLQLFRRAAEAGISIAPGPMFSATRSFHHCLRLNFGHPWSEQLDAAMATLGGLIGQA